MGCNSCEVRERGMSRKLCGRGFDLLSCLVRKVEGMGSDIVISKDKRDRSCVPSVAPTDNTLQ